MLHTWEVILVSDQGNRCKCECVGTSDTSKALQAEVYNAENEIIADVSGIIDEKESGIYLQQIKVSDETVALDALLIPADPKPQQKWNTTASEKIKVRGLGTLNVKVDVEIEVLGITSGINLAVKSKVVAKKRFVPIPIKKTFEGEILLDPNDYSPLAVHIKEGERFNRLIV